MIWRQPLSLRARMTAGVTLAFGLLLAFVNVTVHVATRYFQLHELDAQVRTLAAAELSQAINDNRGPHLHNFPAELLGSEHYAEKFGQVLDAGGSVLAATANTAGLPPLPPPGVIARALAGEPTLIALPVGSQTVRFAVIAAREADRTYVVSIGLSTAHIQRGMRRMLWLLVAIWVVGTTVAAVIGLLVTSRALAPIDSITRRAAAIARGDFAARLDPPPHDDEVGRMTTLLNEMLERLHGAIQANRRFAADASHELRSPLTAMAGEVDVALKRDRPAEEYRETLGYVRDHVGQMTELIEDLMVLVRAQERTTDRVMQEVDVGPIVAAAIDRVRRAAQARQLTVVASGCAGTVLYGDARLYSRVFDNVIANAVQYSREGGTVDVDATWVEAEPGAWSPDRVRFAVTNNGPRIPAEEWERIFERFHRLDASRSRRTGGSGLGLSICRAVVTLFGGSIRVASSTDEATTFEIELPGRRQSAAAGDDPARAEVAHDPAARDFQSRTV
jgi:two-component system OmpR family sensor kinase